MTDTIPNAASRTAAGPTNDRDVKRKPLPTHVAKVGRAPRPPEVAASDIDKLLDRMRTLAPPPKVDAAWARSFNLTDATIILGWLGLVKDGKVVDPAVWNRVRIPATRAAALGDLVRSSYASIFEQIDVAEATREDLEGAFVNEYNLGDTRRYVRAFATLCRHSEIPVRAFEGRTDAGAADSVALPRREVARRSAKQAMPLAAAKEKTKERLGTPRSTFHHAITVSVQIAPDWTEDQIRERLSSVNRILAEDGER